MVPSGKTNMAIENGPSEDVFPIENSDFFMLVYRSSAGSRFCETFTQKCAETLRVNLPQCNKASCRDYEPP